MIYNGQLGTHALKPRLVQLWGAVYHPSYIIFEISSTAGVWCICILYLTFSSLCILQCSTKSFTFSTKNSQTLEDHSSTIASRPRRRRQPIGSNQEGMPWGTGPFSCYQKSEGTSLPGDRVSDWRKGCRGDWARYRAQVCCLWCTWTRSDEQT